MSDISTITLDGVTYDIKDKVARQQISSLDSQLDTVQDDVQSLIAAVGTPLVASTVSAMTDHNKIYVYTGSESGYTNGHWYYWDGSAWTDGGVYNSTAFETDKTLSVENMAADAKATGNAVDKLKSALDIYPQILDRIERYGLNAHRGGISSMVSDTFVDKVKVYYVSDELNVNYRRLMYYDGASWQYANEYTVDNIGYGYAINSPVQNDIDEIKTDVDDVIRKNDTIYTSYSMRPKFEQGTITGEGVYEQHLNTIRTTIDNNMGRSSNVQRILCRRIYVCDSVF